MRSACRTLRDRLGLLLLAVVLAGCGNDTLRSVSLAAQGIYTSALSDDGRLVVIGSLNHGASLWRCREHERVYSWNHGEGEYTALTAAAISADSSHAVTADPRTLVIWDVATGNADAFWATPSSVLDLDIDNSGRRVLMGLEDHSAVLFDADSGSHLLTLLHEGPVTRVALSIDNQLGMTASEDGSARIWDLTTGDLKLRVDASGPIRTAALSRDGRWLLVAARNAELDLYDVENTRRQARLRNRNPGVISARFSPAGDVVALGLVNREALLFDTGSGREIQSLRLPAKPSLGGGGRAIHDLAFGDGGTLYAMSGDGTLSTLDSGLSLRRPLAGP
ncbi:MAG: PQQ-binding-like beta-propeller repeat protein [Pseudomonadota bacterium]